MGGLSGVFRRPTSFRVGVQPPSDAFRDGVLGDVWYVMRATGHYSPLRAEVELRRLEGVMEYLKTCDSVYKVWNG